MSIGLPVYNGERFLVEALESVLAQTFRDFELVISDNGSTDATEQICRRFAAGDARIRFLRSDSNRGAAWNFNTVFEHSRGAYFKWFAHDDLLAPDYLERCVERLAACDASVALVYPERIIMTYGGVVLGPDRRVRWFEATPPYASIGFLRSFYIPERHMPALAFALIRREALLETRLIGAYNLADLVLATELRLAGEFAYVPGELFFNRGHHEDAAFVADRRTVRGEADWYDPGRPPRPVLPELRLLAERLRAVARARIPTARKAVLSTCVLVGTFTMRPLERLAPRADHLISRLFALWSAASLAAARDTGHALLAPRLWVLLAGLRARSADQVGLALGRATPATRVSLLSFVATRLARRTDRDAAQLLRAWREGACAERRSAALSVASGDPERTPAGGAARPGSADSAAR